MSQIIEKQTLEIQKVKKIIKSINKKVAKATTAQIKKTPIMVSCLTIIVVVSSQPENRISFIVPYQAQTKPTQSRKKLNIIINLSSYNIFVKNICFLVCAST